MDSGNVFKVLAPLLMIAAAIGSIVWAQSRGKSMLETWAHQNGYEILSSEECWFFSGPFFWTSSKGQKVYKVTVSEAEGRIRSGYVRCGSFWLGLWSDRVDARWDD